MKRILKNGALAALAVIVYFLSPVALKAEIKLPVIFDNHMVLQQQSEVRLWGQATARTGVSIKTSWDNMEYTSKSDKAGKWEIKVKTPGAGGPYEITISDGEELKLRDILIGEVWVCSGQSNMEMGMNGFKNQPILGANRAIATSANRNLRLIDVERNTSLDPLSDFEASWQESNPGSVAKFSATAYFFGELLQEALGVPVGLICSIWGAWG